MAEDSGTTTPMTAERLAQIKARQVELYPHARDPHMPEVLAEVDRLRALVPPPEKPGRRCLLCHVRGDHAPGCGMAPPTPTATEHTT